LARAKNTARAEARRRARTAARVDEDLEDNAAPDESTAEQPRRPLFRLPDVRADLLALPAMFRTRRALWLPVLMMLVGFALMYLIYANVLIADLENLAALYVQFFFVPFGLFTFFIGGFLAPRASYLVGLLLGVLNGVLWTILIFIGSSVPTTGEVTGPPLDPVGQASQVFGIAIVYGTLAAAFAAWYRDFLRGMQERGRARRAEQESKEKARRREERRTTR
jgi:hypothetical protein